MKPALILWTAGLGLCLVFMLGPLFLVILFSFGTNALIGFPMGGLTLAWYERLLGDAGFLAAFRTSLLIAVGTAIIATATGTLAAPRVGWVTSTSAPRSARRMASLPARGSATKARRIQYRARETWFAQGWRSRRSCRGSSAMPAGEKSSG